MKWIKYIEQQPSENGEYLTISVNSCSDIKIRQFCDGNFYNQPSILWWNFLLNSKFCKEEEKEELKQYIKEAKPLKRIIWWMELPLKPIAGEG